MPGRNRHLVALALFTAAWSSGPAQAQIHTPRAKSDGYPCGSGPRLEVVERGQGFTIQPAGIADGLAKRAMDAMVPVGRALKLDRALVESVAPLATEMRDGVHP